MKELDVRYANHPEDSKHYTTEELRKHYLIENVFVEDDIALTYSHQDRIIAGGAYPVNKVLKLEAGDALRADYFLQRRELGIINIAGDGVVTLDGVEYELTKTVGNSLLNNNSVAGFILEIYHEVPKSNLVKIFLR